MSNIRCTDGVNIAWDQPNGNCGTQTTVKRCDDWSGRPGGAAFGSDGNRDGYVCSNNKCGAEPNLVSRVYLCNLTGAAAAQLCTDILPVNLPF